ncbi:glycerol-3-phosphate dehydrogenase [Saccharopolyspora erythraea NRRL 2338]|uniref:Glycerol-3-phosphate dehydrogenase n=2 Tax=Saccharopolyspora erythraea TaxID=1836 RepID=A4F7H8_SACEN|nr:FAD-dependent oxidoreductase [Saccharopolyspora erythraea]EQD84271.1 glycerol-3-phosphate dehydrogenase [Saccharopolyspora erythraea D]PFG93804.1 glycerol-3-phosphate dehydrogenase [Saccharopolyspora erythraea NRRL 2338]QRK90637.1 FAD-dependent oxidoreductase [Saccharopolyspora erythraea]CAM00002.1 glycerol-3-phosphate dehydrogenase [Saccharopolyspora erythraea NRRL 2338]
MITTPLPAGSLRATSLNASRRAEELSAVGDDEVDVLVVGGGVTGTGVALDAAARGLSVALVEAEDLAWGNSRWSSKLVDGDLASLTAGDLLTARESAVERGVLMTRTAPHLVRTMPQLIPLHQSASRRAELLLTAGLRAGDALRRAARTPSSALPAPRRVSAPEALALVPGLRAAGLRGGLLGFDGQLVDDARLVIALARTAAGFGARVLTRVRVTALDRDGADTVDERSGESLRIRARSVVNATGVWAGVLAPEVRLRAVRSAHLVVDADAAGLAGTSLIAPLPTGGFLRFLPQPDGRAYLGATEGQTLDTPAELSVPRANESDVDTLLSAVRDLLGAPLERTHVMGSFAALRAVPEVSGGSRLRRRPEPLSRRHSVLTSPDGIVTVAGGRLTTYRRAAADAVDTAIEAAGMPAGPSRTTAVALVGAAGRHQLTDIEADARLVAKYGTEAVRVAALSELDPDLADTIAPGLTAAEVLWAVRHEGALDVDDVLDRRTRIGLDAGARAAARPAVAELVNRALEGVWA